MKNLTIHSIYTAEHPPSHEVFDLKAFERTQVSLDILKYERHFMAR
jgi:hypothetical protein